MSSDKNELANQSYFLDAWLLMPQFFWVKRAKVNTDYKCKLCNKENKLSNLGVKALEKHAVGATHKQMLDIHEKNKYFFKPKSQIPKNQPKTSASTSESSPTSASTCESSAQSASLSTSAPTANPQSSSTSAPTNTAQSSIPFRDEAWRQKSEVIWTLCCVQNNISDHANDNIPPTLKAMYPIYEELLLTKIQYQIREKFWYSPTF